MIPRTFFLESVFTPGCRPCGAAGLPAPPEYFSSYLSLVADRKFKPEQHIKVLSNTRPYQGGSEYENSFGGVKYRLPYLPSLEEQAATLKLLEPLSGKEAKTYEPVIAAIAGEVFGDGK